MTDNAKLDIDSTPMIASVGKATKALDQLLRAMESLSKGGNDAYKALVIKAKGAEELTKSVKTQAEVLIEAAATMEGEALRTKAGANRQQLNLVAQLNKDMQQRFEEFATQQLAANKGLTAEMLKVWSQSGANLSREQRKWLQEQVATDRAAVNERSTLLKLEADVEAAMYKARLAKASAFAKEQVAIAMQTSGPYTRLDGKTGAAAGVEAGGAAAQAAIEQKLLTESSVKNINSQLVAMRTATEEKLKLAKLEDAASARTAALEAEKTAALVKGINAQLAVIRAGDVEKRKLQEAYQLDVLRDVARFESEKAAMARTGAASFISGPFKGQRMDASEVVKYQAEMSNLNKITPTLVPPTKKLADAHLNLNTAFKEGNAAMRGFTQGLGTLSAGMYSMLPFMASFLAGAALMKTLKVGSEFETSMFVIGELAGNSTESMAKLRESVLALSLEGQYGPKELAKGLEVLTLAGLTATDAMKALQPTLQFAAATGMPVEKAAETLVAVQSAYAFTTTAFGTIGDLIAKTAADTMASGQSMAEAFRTASVVAQQYKVTLEDTAVALGMLANIGIKGGAAGTSYRNMITELNKGSGKAAEGIKALGVEVQNLDGSTRNIMEVMKGLSSGLITKTGAAQQRLLQDMTNERGAKAVAAFQAQMLQHLNAANPLLQEQADKLFAEGKLLEGNTILIKAVEKAYDEMRAKMQQTIDTSAAFDFLANLEKRLTTDAQYKSILAVLEKDFVDTFAKVGDSVFVLGQKLQEAFKSETFNNALTAVVKGIVMLVESLVSLSEWVADNQNLSLALAAIAGVALAVFSGPVGIAAGATVATVAVANLVGTMDDLTVAQKANMEVALKANLLKIADTEKQMSLQLESQTKVLEGLRNKDKAEETSIKAAGAAHIARIDQAYKQKMDLIELTRLLYVKNEVERNGYDNILDIDQASRAMAKTLSSGLSMEKMLATDKAEYDMQRMLDLTRQIAIVTKENAAKANAIPHGINDKAGYTGKDKKKFGERFEPFAIKQDSDTETNVKLYATELTRLKEHEANVRKILDAAHSDKAVSEGAYAAQSLALTTSTEAEQLSILEKASARRIQDFNDDNEKATRQYREALATKHINAEEAAKKLDAALHEYANKFDSDMAANAAASAKVQEAAATRKQIAINKQIGALKQLDLESTLFWQAEEKRQRKLATGTALEDSLRGASPEAQARISAVAAEQEYWNEKIAEQAAAVKIASQTLIDYQLEQEKTGILSAEATQAEEDFIAVLNKKQKFLDQLKSKGATLPSKAGEVAVIKLNKDNQQKLSDDVASAIETGLLQGGEAGKAKLRDIIVAELMKPIRLIIQAVVNPIMGAISGSLGLNGMAGAAGGSVAGGIGGGGLFSGVTSGFANGMTAASEGGSFAGMLANSELYSLSELAGGAISGISSALAMIPGWGWAAMGALALFGGGNGFKSSAATGGAAVSFDSTGKKVDNSTFDFTTSAVDKIVDGLQATYSSTAKALGIQLANTNFNYNGNTGAQGEDPQFALGGGAGSVSAYQGETKLTDEAVSLAASRAVFAALQGSKLPKHLEGVFNDLTANSATQEQITAALEKAKAFAVFHEAMQALPLEQLKDLSYGAANALAEAAGGLETLSANIATYYDKFYTETEKTANTTANVSKVFSELGLQMPALDENARGLFRGMVEGLDLTKEADQKTYTSLLSVAGAFDSLLPPIEKVKTAAELAKEAIDKAAESSRVYQSWMDKFNILTKTTTERQISLRDALVGVDAKTAVLIGIIYALEDAATAAAAALEALKTRMTSLETAKTASIGLVNSALSVVETSIGTAQAELKDAYDKSIGALELQEQTLKKTYDDAVDAQNKLKTIAEKARTDATDVLKAEREAAADTYKNASKAIDTERKNAVAVFNTAKNAAVKAIEASTASLNLLKSLDSSLQGALNFFKSNDKSVQSRQAGQAQIEEALAGALNGQFPTAESLADAIAAVTQPSDQFFSDFVDYQRDYFKTANSVSKLANLTSTALSKEEATLKTLQDSHDLMVTQHEDNMSRLDGIKESLDLAYEAQQLGFDAREKNISTSYTSVVNPADAELARLAAAYKLATEKITDDKKDLTETYTEASDVLAQQLAQQQAIAANTLGTKLAVESIPEAIANLAIALETYKTADANVDTARKAIGNAELSSNIIANQINKFKGDSKDGTGADAAALLVQWMIENGVSTKQVLDSGALPGFTEQNFTDYTAAKGIGSTDKVLTESGTAAGDVLKNTAIAKASENVVQATMTVAEKLTAHIAGMQRTLATNSSYDWRGDIVGYAKSIGASAAMVDTALGAPAGTTNTWAVANGIPAFARGTNYVPEDMLAQIHKGEAIIPAAFNPTTYGRDSGNEELIAEIKELRAILAKQQAALENITVNTGRTTKQLNKWDTDGLPLETTVV